MIQATTNNSLAFALKIMCFKKLLQTRTSMIMKLAVSIHRTGVTDSNGDWDEDIAIGTSWQTWPIDDRFTVNLP